MISTVYDIPLRNDNMEDTKRGTAFFSCCAYTGNINNYIGKYLPPHWHNEMEMFILDSGSVCVTSADSNFILGPGDEYFANSEALHGIYSLTDSPCNFHSIVFEPSIIAGSPGSAFDLLYTRPFIEHAASIIPIYENVLNKKDLLLLFEKAFDACKNEPSAYEFIVRNKLSDILLLLREMDDQKNTPSAAKAEGRLKSMLLWIENNYAGNVTAAEIAASANISIRECQRSFSVSLNTTPSKYLLNYRLSKASEMLISTDTPIIEIAAKNGFNDTSYFTKQFHRFIGVSPREYRKNHSHKPSAS